jgi:hypothetical protein
MKASIAHTLCWLIISFNLLIRYIPSAAFPCNSFPKIFGKNGGNYFLNQIDVFDDYLALAGRTDDTSFTSVTVLYIALTSI